MAEGCSTIAGLAGLAVASATVKSTSSGSTSEESFSGYTSGCFWPCGLWPQFGEIIPKQACSPPFCWYSRISALALRSLQEVGPGTLQSSPISPSINRPEELRFGKGHQWSASNRAKAWDVNSRLARCRSHETQPVCDSETVLVSKTTAKVSIRRHSQSPASASARS